MTFHVSFVLFEFKMFLLNDVLVVFIFCLILLLIFLYATEADIVFFELLRTLICFFDSEYLDLSSTELEGE